MSSTDQWTQSRPSGSSTINTSDFVPAGTPAHARPGERSAPRHVYSGGIGPLEAKASDLSWNDGGDSLGGEGAAEGLAGSDPAGVGADDGTADVVGAPESPNACGVARPLEPLHAPKRTAIASAAAALLV